MQPRILLSGGANFQNYVQAVEGCGGIPLGGYLPEVDTDCDGLILCGGCDVEPHRYGESVNGTLATDPARDDREMALIRAFVEAGKPILGICRGQQILNVYFGGSLIQHLPSAHCHTSGENFDLVHMTLAPEGSLLHRLYGDTFPVNSSHHQAISRLGEGLEVIQTSLHDGVIEGIRHTTLPIVCVLWHPERMCFANARPDTADGSVLIRSFLDLCRK